MVVVILFIVLNVIKAKVDYHVISGRFSKYHNYKWHQWYFYHYVAMSIGILWAAYGVNHIFLLGLVYASMIRIAVFNTVLNRLRGLALFHLGDQGIDGRIQKRRCFSFLKRKYCFRIRKEVYYLIAFALASFTGVLLWLHG